MFQVKEKYSVCVIDSGSPKKLGWCFIDAERRHEEVGSHLDNLLPLIEQDTKKYGLIIGFEAPLSIPIRKDLMRATSARKGDGNRAWSAGAGPIVLAANLPIMVYLFKGLRTFSSGVNFHLNESYFRAQPNNIMIFEAFISGTDKGTSHINDAQILTRSCMKYSERLQLPPSILGEEKDVEFFNLAAAALMRCDLLHDISMLSKHCPIYKPH